MSDPIAAGQALQNMHSSFSGIMSMVSGLAYVMGAAFGVKAALCMQERNEDPQRVPLSKFLMFALVSGVMLTVPTFISIADVATDAPDRARAAHVQTLTAADPAPAQRGQPKEAAAPLAAPQAAAAQTPSEPVVTFHDSDPAPVAPIVKEPAHGGSGDMQALLEIVSLFLALAMVGYWAVVKAAKRGQARREASHAAIVELGALEAPLGGASRNAEASS